MDDIQARKAEIDTDLLRMTKKQRKEWAKTYTPAVLTVLDSLIEFLHRGGKRVRGSLAMESYYLHGGTNKKVALGAARVIELVQASLLIMDDIQDNSAMRRGGPTVHKQLVGDNTQHYGIAQGLNAEMLANQWAMGELLALPVVSTAKIQAAQLLHHNISVTIAGQINDIYNQIAKKQIDEQAIISALTWKTAYYTFISPLELGACLAGETRLSERLRHYALNAGLAFQIHDDILGVFGNAKTAGKSSNDDIREGKATLLATYAYHHATASEQRELDAILGKATASEQECDRVRAIFGTTGAHKYAAQLAQRYAWAAEKALGDNPEDFLVALVRFAVKRTV